VTEAATPTGAGRLTPKGQATRERIVAAAARLMFRHGVAGTTTEDVQAAAGVSASQLYHYFPDKQALVRAVIAYQTEAVLDAQQPVLSELDSLHALQTWRNQVIAIAEALHCEGGCPIGSLANELAENDPAARADLAAGFTRWEHAIRDGLRAMHARGDLYSDADPDQLALGILATYQGGLLLVKTHRNIAPLQAALDLALAHIRSLHR
jgi:TetR/AcrR family transcriptional regulator, transcriptional repressor for nem operon